MNNTRNEELLLAFGQHIRNLRKQRNLSMEKLAELSEIDYRLLSYIEKGEVNTTISTVFQLASGLDLPLEDLFKFSMKPDKE